MRPTTLFLVCVTLGVGCQGMIGQGADPPEGTSGGIDMPAAGGGAKGGTTGTAGGGATGGATGGPSAGGAGGTAPPCNTFEGSPGPIRRLTRTEYNDTVRDLLGDTSAPALQFQSDADLAGFANNTTSPISAAIATDYLAAAEALSRAAMGKLSALLPCSAASAGEEPCARQFVAAFGKRAFRRPLAPEEITGLMGVYTATRTRGDDFGNGIRMVIQAMLQSASFLNHVDLPAAGATGATVPLAPHAIASRLSYLLWRTMPDGMLMAAADAGALSTPEQVEAQARRMIADPRARPSLLSFYDQWLELASLTDDDFATAKSSGRGYRADLGPSMRQETTAFIEDVLWRGDGRVETLLGASHSFLNQTLATLYKVTGVTGTQLQRVELKAAERAGFLTQPGFLAAPVRSKEGLGTDPIHRGLWVRQHLLCQDVPSPAGDIADMVKLPDPVPGETTRDRYMRMLDLPACAACHRLINPIGVGMEKYDGFGQYRTTENMKVIDTRGAIDGLSEPLAFDGLPDLSRRLAKTAQVRDCVAKQWLGYATGAFDYEGATCNARKLVADFAATGGDLREIALVVVRNAAFRTRVAVKKEACQ